MGIFVAGYERRVWKLGWRLVCVSGEDSSIRKMEACIEREIVGKVSKNTKGLLLGGLLGGSG